MPIGVCAVRPLWLFCFKQLMTWFFGPTDATTLSFVCLKQRIRIQHQSFLMPNHSLPVSAPWSTLLFGWRARAILEMPDNMHFPSHTLQIFSGGHLWHPLCNLSRHAQLKPCSQIQFFHSPWMANTEEEFFRTCCLCHLSFPIWHPCWDQIPLQQ